MQTYVISRAAQPTWEAVRNVGRKLHLRIDTCILTSNVNASLRLLAYGQVTGWNSCMRPGVA